MIHDSNEPSYVNPPITEVVLELRLASELSSAKLKKIYDALTKRYKTTKRDDQVEIKFDGLARTASFRDKAPIYSLNSDDLTDSCILSVRSLAWVRRSPYPGWAAFIDRVGPEITTALKTLDKQIERLGLRYVNRIDVKPEGDVAPYEKYLNFRIDHGPLFEPTGGYQWLVAKRFPDTGLKALVQSASLEEEMPGMAAFSFDIDVGCDIEVPQKASDILDKLEAMRALKNTIFEAGISDHAREMYV
ncbi:MAG: TIGR04255 family protein [Sphingomonas sp.]|uniref:TIGR04255 family protein n=1 Tax=Sphingomonas sp. TaxID=28214 RepID=UPI001208DE12|nr:TIGR04255 family protein [Sphingomonas sp.]THD38303.1 MAG: TIGR04255 family protein [Sphingomonas sp.]